MSPCLAGEPLCIPLPWLGAASSRTYYWVPEKIQTGNGNMPSMLPSRSRSKWFSRVLSKPWSYKQTLSHAKSLLVIQAIIEIDLLDPPFQRLDPALPETLATASNQQRNKLYTQKQSTRGKRWMKTKYQPGGGHIPYHRMGVQDPTEAPTSWSTLLVTAAPYAAHFCPLLPFINNDGKSSFFPDRFCHHHCPTWQKLPIIDWKMWK